ncbi:MAG: glycerate kinase [Bacteroidota bacterium]|nr:glycerate kinase [Bacteroidota bacterium]
MRILVAPDVFKGSLSARTAAAIIRKGIKRAIPGANVDILPLADGGEGTVEALSEAWGAEPHETVVSGPDGKPVRAAWALTSDEGRGSVSTAVLEAASAVGFALVPERGRDPLRLSSYGLGELILHAAEADPKTILVGLGDSATNDCGLGLAVALGYALSREDGSLITRDCIFSGSLTEIMGAVHSIGRKPEGIRGHVRSVVVLADVSNPLLGERGATAVYGPQKGLNPALVDTVESLVRRFAGIVRRDVRDVDPMRPGAGAAGGLGFALSVFLGAEIRPGAEYILEACSFRSHAALADVVVTGEGCLDEQSLRGKAVSAVAAACAELGKPCLVIAGRVKGNRAEWEEKFGLMRLYSTIETPGEEVPSTLPPAAERLESAAERMALELMKAFGL